MTKLWRSIVSFSAIKVLLKDCHIHEKFLDIVCALGLQQLNSSVPFFATGSIISAQATYSEKERTEGDGREK